MSAKERYIVFNERNQPVELHVDKQVIVVAERGQVELDGAQVAAPQLQGLVTRGLLTVQAAPEEKAKATTGKRKKQSAKPKTGRGRRKPK
ncbi:MAG: hypothetical protein IT331_17315 [Anaerolineae bacterium]|nr:hypothetical protein [Anaerolineae bacterium]